VAVSVTIPQRHEEWWPDGAVKCFLCGDEFRLDRRPAVAWHGWHHHAERLTIVLHAECARSLGTHLIADGSLALVAGGGPDWWTRRARPLIAAALAAEEQRR
jgi:hypothetical protein